MLTFETSLTHRVPEAQEVLGNHPVLSEGIRRNRFEGLPFQGEGALLRAGPGADFEGTFSSDFVVPLSAYRSGVRPPQVLMMRGNLGHLGWKYRNADCSVIYREVEGRLEGVGREHFHEIVSRVAVLADMRDRKVWGVGSNQCVAPIRTESQADRVMAYEPDGLRMYVSKSVAKRMVMDACQQVLSVLPVVERIEHADALEGLVSRGEEDGDLLVGGERSGYDASTKTYWCVRKDGAKEAFGRAVEGGVTRSGAVEAVRSVFGALPVFESVNSASQVALVFFTMAALFRKHLGPVPGMFIRVHGRGQGTGKTHMAECLSVLAGSESGGAGACGYNSSNDFMLSDSMRSLRGLMARTSSSVVVLDNITPSREGKVRADPELAVWLTSKARTTQVALTGRGPVSADLARLFCFTVNDGAPEQDLGRRVVLFTLDREGCMAARKESQGRGLAWSPGKRAGLVGTLLACWRDYQLFEARAHARELEGQKLYDERYTTYRDALDELLPFCLWVCGAKAEDSGFHLGQGLFDEEREPEDHGPKALYGRALERTCRGEQGVTRIRALWRGAFGSQEVTSRMVMERGPLAASVLAFAGSREGIRDCSAMGMGRVLQRVKDDLGLKYRNTGQARVYWLGAGPWGGGGGEFSGDAGEDDSVPEVPEDCGGGEPLDEPLGESWDEALDEADEAVIPQAPRPRAFGNHTHDLEAVKARHPLREEIIRVLGRPNAEEKWLCPFHAERTPSFGLLPGGMRYHCFGCNAGGDVLDFVSWKYGYQVPAGLGKVVDLLEGGKPRGPTPVQNPVPTPSPPPSREASREGLLEKVEWARKLYASAVPCEDGARIPYLAGRLFLNAGESVILPHLRKLERPLLNSFEMVFPVSLWRENGWEDTGIHRTLLDRTFTKKAAKETCGSRKMMGVVRGGVIRLQGPEEPETVILGEGIETTLAFCQLRDGIPPEVGVWTGLSASNIPAVVFPPCVKKIHFLVDKDVAGRRALEALEDRLDGTGIEVIGEHCEGPGIKDWADVLKAMRKSP